MQNQDDYSLQKPVRRNFKRAKVIVSGPNEQLDVDLATMQSLSQDNDGITYLLVAVDVLSRYTWVEPLKNKTAKEVERGLMIILNQAKRRKIRTDGGSEFNNKWVKTLLENRRAVNEVKANYAKRFNRTIKTMIYTEYYMSKSASHAVSTREPYITPRATGPRGDIGRGLIWHVIQILTCNVHYIIYFNHAFDNTCIL